VKSPIVSICIPVFNAERTIERCLKSVLAQDVDDIEILVVDNNSTDRTVSIASGVLDGVPQAKIVRNKTNLGRVGNWNRCLELASGCYVKFALANDVLFKNSVSALLEEAQEDSETVMVCSRPRFVDSMPPNPPEMQKSPPSESFSGAEMMRYFGEHGCQTGGLNSMLLLREPIVGREIFFREDLPYCSDYFHAIQLAACGKTVIIDAESYCFDSGAKGRFHYAGLSDARTFFREQRQCVLFLARQLRKHGVGGSKAFQYLYWQYLWYLGQGASIPFYDALSIFKGAPVYRWQAFQKGLRYQARQKLSMTTQKVGRQTRQ
jgi:glycosyltransferase involved in cell wall biosynthesis